MKILFISFAFAEYSIRLTSAMARQESVCLFLPRDRAAPHLDRLGPALQFKPFDKPRMRQPIRHVPTFYRLLREIKKYDPAIIHLQQGYIWFNPLLPFLSRYPLILTIHDPSPHVGDRDSGGTPQAILNFGYRHAARVIVHNNQVRQVVIDKHGIPAEFICVVPTVERGDDRDPCQEEEDENLILFFGRIWEYKGLEYLIRAEPLIAAHVPGVKIMIAGEGENFDRYRRMMVHPESFIVRNEYIPHKQVAGLFRMASMVVLPYIDATQSAVIPTAYTFAKPVIATTVGGLPSMVEHGRTGYLIPPRDEQALADSIVHLLQNRKLRREFGAKGKQKLESEYSAESVAQQTLMVYEDALRAAHLPV